MNLTIPEKLARTCSTWPDRREWLARLPEVVAELQARWSLSLGEPYEAAKASWVAPVTDQPAVLKVGMPHMEADHEIDGMRFWDGEPTTHLLEFDVEGGIRRRIEVLAPETLGVRAQLCGHRSAILWKRHACA